ncbi:glycosyltransferase family 4 protein [Vibrio splendidus]|uniref:glycosyltransferase family 4 protein n=1 Tax=Vibrio splendidus TaxID=29497 RepID=UPI001FB4F711|nr:glycosyltransferase family 4 protein [Vibrio splendidus]UOE80911.1 glycosyltransferase family 4 protein [Vibrio splendidus]
MKKMVFIASYPSSILTFRGALISAIQEQGFQVHILAPDMEEELKIPLQKSGVVVHSIPLQRTGLNPLIDLKTIIAMVRLLKKIKPEYTLGYTIKPVIYGSFASRLAGVKHIGSLITGLGYAFTGEAIGKRKIIQSMLHSLYKLALSFNSSIFFQNGDDQTLFKKLNLLPTNLESIVVNGSGIDLEQFIPAPNPESCDFLLIARLLGDKGIREYAAAAKKLKASHPNSTCRLVGWIDENPDAIDQTELNKWTSEGYIEFLGKLIDVKPVIAQASVYVLPSYREGTPRTVLEAMAMARPIITTDAPGCRETVVDGVNGYLIPVQDREALYLRMVELVENKVLVEKMGEASRKMAEQRFDVHKVNDAMLNGLGIK